MPRLGLPLPCCQAKEQSAVSSSAAIPSRCSYCTALLSMAAVVLDAEQQLSLAQTLAACWRSSSCACDLPSALGVGC